MSGINKSQMRKNKFLIIFIVSFVIYLLIEYLFENSMFYLMGGIIGGSINKVFMFFGERVSDYFTYLVWLLLLIGNVYLFFRSQYKPLKYFMLSVIVILLYLFDLILVSIIKIETTEIKLIYLMMGFRILCKSLFLSIVVYLSLRQIQKIH